MQTVRGCILVFSQSNDAASASAVQFAWLYDSLWSWRPGTN